MFRRPILARLSFGAAAIAVTIATAPAVLASTFLLTFTSSGGDIGALRVGLTGSTAISASGTINGNAITGLSPYAGSDQQFFVAGPVHFTVPGLSFAASNGTKYNLTAYPDYHDRITNSVIDPAGYGNPTPYTLTSLSIAAVPVPASLGMTLMGLGAMGIARRAGAKRRTAA